MNPPRLLDKLPQVRAWIGQTLATHQARARPVTSYGFARLPQFYPAEILSSTWVVEVQRVPVPPLADIGLPEFGQFQDGDYDGITYLNTYFVTLARAHAESLHFHELVHITQWQHLGPDRFLMAYAAGYLLAGNYRDNPLEIMAYDFQERFDASDRIWDVESAICTGLDDFIPRLLGQVFGA
jgi:hypothetical protein